MDAEWFVMSSDGGDPVGPVSTDLLVRGLRSGKVPQDALVCAVGSSEWVPVSVALAIPPLAPAPTIDHAPASPVGVRPVSRSNPLVWLAVAGVSSVVVVALLFCGWAVVASRRGTAAETRPLPQTPPTPPAAPTVAESGVLSSDRALSATDRAAAVRTCAREIASKPPACDHKRIRQLVSSASSIDERRELRVAEWNEYMRKALTGIPDGGTPPVDERVFHAEMNLTLIPLTGLLALPKTSLDEALEHPDRARGKLLRVTGVVTEVQNQLGSTIGWLIGGERERVVFFFTTPTKDAVKVTPDSLVVRFAGVFAQTLRKTGTDGRPLKVVVLVGRFESPEPLPSETDVKLWDGLGLRDSGFTYPEPPQPEVVSFDTLRRLAETGMPFGKPYKVCAFYYPNDMPQFCKHNGSYCEEYLAVGDDFLTGSDEKRRLYDRRNKNGCFEVRMFRGGELRITGLL